MSDRLPVRDELYLLAHDERGKPLVHSSILGLGLAAALLVDLALQGEIDSSSGRVLTRPRPRADNTPGLGLDMVDRALAELTAGRTDPPTTQDVLLAWQTTMYERVRGELMAANILESVKSRKLGLVSVTRHRLVDEAVAVRCRTALRRIVTGQNTPTAEDAALCGLMMELQLERALHLSSDIGSIRQTITQIVSRHSTTVRQILAATADAIRFRSTTLSM